MFFTVNTIAELGCFLVALCFLARDRELPWRLWILYLALTCVTEFGGIYLRRVVHVHNSWLYNLFVLGECGMNTYFFAYLYHSFGKRERIAGYWLLGFLVIYSTESIINGFNAFVAVTTSMMSIVFVIASVRYYYLLLSHDGYVKISRHAAFWWVNGTMLFYFGSTATNLFFDYLIRFKSPDFSRSVHYIISETLDVLLYCCLSLSFIFRWYQQRSLISSSSQRSSS